MERPKTIFCDIDGTLWNHVGDVSNQATIKEHQLLPNTKEAISKWDKLGYKIILTTGRKESLRSKTENELLRLGIVYDKLIMGLGGGVRIIINDRKPREDKNTCYAINVIRNKGIPYYDFTSKFVTIKDNQPDFVNKPWGKEELIEYNDHYVVKKLFIKANECCSMQYHELKRETIYILSGKVKLHIGTDIKNLKLREMVAGDKVTITPYTIHRMEGIEDSEYIECSTPELWDVIRLSDKYKRENTTEMDYQ
jgi:mannose-6-phosphate isomerase